jgi:hypothetical protein
MKFFLSVIPAKAGIHKKLVQLNGIDVVNYIKNIF